MHTRWFYANVKYVFRYYYQNDNVPHIHAEYGDDEAVFDFDGNLIEGALPKKKERLVQAWINIHEEELAANWKLLSEGEQFFKIPPLQ